jgi:CrcB protein
MLQFLLVAFGGAVGSVLRYYVGLSALRVAGPLFPWGTLTVNVVGCFLIGLLAQIITQRYGGSVELRLLLITGFLGGFTTFSAFSLDTVALIESGNLAGAILYVAASVGASLAAVLAGLLLVRSFA